MSTVSPNGSLACTNKLPSSCTHHLHPTSEPAFPACAPLPLFHPPPHPATSAPPPPAAARIQPPPFPLGSSDELHPIRGPVPGATPQKRGGGSPGRPRCSPSALPHRSYSHPATSHLPPATCLLTCGMSTWQEVSRSREFRLESRMDPSGVWCSEALPAVLLLLAEDVTLRRSLKSTKVDKLSAHAHTDPAGGFLTGSLCSVRWLWLWRPTFLPWPQLVVRHVPQAVRDVLHGAFHPPCPHTGPTTPAQLRVSPRPTPATLPPCQSGHLWLTPR